MEIRSRRSAGLALIVSAGLLAGLGSATAQAQAVHPSDMLRSGMAPKFAPSGDWAEILTVTPRWLVIQNASGQQFPVSVDSMGLFVIRWPMDPTAISPAALVETTGVQLGSHRISTDHVDVFEGTARNLVQPIFQEIIGFGRTPTYFDIQAQNNYGRFIPLLPGEDQMPVRLHIVGPAVGLDPLSIGASGNVAVSVFPSGSGLFFSQVTPGSVGYLRPGDLVYYVPTGIAPKTLILSQIVAYKTMSFSQFTP